MFSTHRYMTAVAAVLLSAVVGQSQTTAPLTVGSKAPALQLSRWVKGDGISKLESGKVYVVEFWATWCGPCKGAIPHITELAHTYKDKVTFIGVSVAEGKPSQAIEDKVNAFVSDMGEKMDYLVARDTDSDAMLNTWMKAAEQKGIPTAFIVDGDGKIAWIGNPMRSLDKAIDQVLAKAK